MIQEEKGVFPLSSTPSRSEQSELNLSICKASAPHQSTLPSTGVQIQELPSRLRRQHCSLQGRVAKKPAYTSQSSFTQAQAQQHGAPGAASADATASCHSTAPARPCTGTTQASLQTACCVQKRFGNTPDSSRACPLEI